MIEDFFTFFYDSAFANVQFKILLKYFYRSSGKSLFLGPQAFKYSSVHCFCVYILNGKQFVCPLYPRTHIQLRLKEYTREKFFIFKFKFKNYFNRMFWRRSSETKQLLLSVSLRIQLFFHPVDRDVDRWR